MKPDSALDFKALFEIASALSLVLLPDLSIAAVTETYLKATITAREDIIGQNFFEIFPDNSSDTVTVGVFNLRLSFNDVMYYKQPQTITVKKYDIHHPGGVFEERYCNVLNTPVLDKDDNVVYIIHNLTPETIQQKIADKLKKDEKGDQLLINNIKDHAFFMIDQKGCVASWNSAAEHIHGYKAEEIIGRPMDVFYTASQIKNEAAKTNLKKAAEDGFFETEDWQVRKDKTTFFANIMYTVLRNEEGVVYGYSKIIRDITQREKDLDKIDLLSHQINQSNDAIYTLDDTFKITSWNKGAENLYGFTEQDALGKNSIELLQTDITNTELNKTLEKLKANDYWTGKLKRITKDGNPIYVNASTTHIRDKYGRITGYVAVNIDLTHQKKLRKEIDHLAKIVEQSSEAIFSIDRNYRIISWNVGAEKLFGLSKEDAIGKKISEPGFIKLSAHQITEIERAIFNNSIWKAEMNYYHKDGNSFFGEVTSSAIQNEKRENTSYYFIVKDISLRKKIEEQLMRYNEELEEKVKSRTNEIYKNEKLFRALIENNNDVISMLDEQFTVFYRSPSASRITGWSDEEVIHMNITKNIYPEDLANCKKIMQELLENPGKSFNTLFRNQHKNGHYFWVEGTINNLLEDENIHAILFNFRDVTERITAEEKLALRESHFRALIENISDAIVLNDEHSTILYQSPSVTKILGYSLKERDGKRVLDYIHPDDVKKLNELYADLRLSPNLPLPFQYRFLHKHKHYIWLEGVVTNLLQNPAVKAFVANYRDITERKEAEQKIIDLNTELEERVKNRTEQLKKSNEEMESFSYSVSHDLRSPLRAINGYTTILEEDYTSHLDDEAKRITSVIKNNTVKMGNLIDGLLAFSRTSKYEIIKVPIDQQQLVKEIIANQEIKQINEKSIRWIVGSLPSIKAESYTIKQVWINLISNAVKYSANATEPKIEIGSFNKDGKITFFIKDNGVGFDEKYKDKLFKVFQRLHSSNEFEGTGIGLAIVEKIITKYGGKVWVKSALNKGACFFFSVPDE